MEIAKFEGWEKIVLMTRSALRGALDSAAEESRGWRDLNGTDCEEGEFTHARMEQEVTWQQFLWCRQPWGFARWWRNRFVVLNCIVRLKCGLVMVLSMQCIWRWVIYINQKLLLEGVTSCWCSGWGCQEVDLSVETIEQNWHGLNVVMQAD